MLGSQAMHLQWTKAPKRFSNHIQLHEVPVFHFFSFIHVIVDFMLALIDIHYGSIYSQITNFILNSF